MSVLNDGQRRALTFIQGANHGGYSPTSEEVLEWVLRPKIRPGKVTRRRVTAPSLDLERGFGGAGGIQTLGYDIAKAIAPWSEQFRATSDQIAATLSVIGSAGIRPDLLSDHWVEDREPDETILEQMQRFRWIKSSSEGPGVLLTDLGRALLRADAADLSSSTEVTILGGDDPLAWSSVVGTIAEVGECLIVDPYLQIDQLLAIAQHTSATRVLMRRPDKDTKLVPWRICMASPDIQVTMRVASPSLLHDRFIVGETEVWTLGCSLNGVGRKPTTLVPLTGPVADQIRSIAEGWWEASEPIGDPPEPAPTGEENRDPGGDE